LHVTARTQGREKWFTEDIRSRIVADVEDAARSFGHVLLAQTVMPNHLHIVLRQGTRPLGWMMQRVMQRAAYFVQRFHGTKDHVFGGPYWCCVCSTPAYLRRAIVYTHLNACAAGLCDRPQDYKWNSHLSYMKSQADADPTIAGYLEGRMLFARDSARVADLIQSYRGFVDYVIERRRSGIPGDWLLPVESNRLFIPATPFGDAHWAQNYSAFVEAQPRYQPSTDIVNKVKELLRTIDANCDIDMLRHAGRSKAIAPLRRNITAALLSCGYRGNAIARCLRVSPSLVSQVAAAMRAAATQQH
jgi:REP element-mobilizing transposase RayT